MRETYLPSTAPVNISCAATGYRIPACPCQYRDRDDMEGNMTKDAAARAVRLLVDTAVWLAAGWLFSVALLYVCQRSLLFPAPTEVPGEPPAGAAAARVLTVGDQWVAAWFRPPAAGKPTLLFFGGNGASLEWSWHVAEKLSRPGDGVLVATYPGYQGNPGAPSERSIRLAAEGAWRWLAKETGGGPVVVGGWSLGSGVAAGVAARHDVRALALFSPYDSLEAVAAETYPTVPVRFLIKDRFDTLALLPKVRAPVLVVHGTADSVIGAAHGRRVAEAAGATLVLQQGAGHVLDWSAAGTAIADFTAAHGIDW
jgi:pimeloyl-ACP methyl ester carboxylesterase